MAHNSEVGRLISVMEKTSNLWRILQILLKIQQRPGLKAADLAESCEISVRTVYRYVTILRMADVPIITDNGYRLSENFYLPNLKLNLSEALGIILAAGGFKKMSGDLLAGSINAALDKILDSLPDNLRNIADNAPRKFIIGQDAPVDYTPYQKRFAVINQAADENISLNISYHSLGRQKSVARLADPFGVVFRDGFCYLVAYCHTRQSIRLFRLDRIESLSKTKKPFKRPSDFSLQRYMADSWRVAHGKLREVKIKFSGNGARLVREASWHSSQRLIKTDKDSVIVSYKVSGLHELCAWLLCFGGEAEVLEPPELRRLVRETAQAVAVKNK